MNPLLGITGREIESESCECRRRTYREGLTTRIEICHKVQVTNITGFRIPFSVPIDPGDQIPPQESLIMRIPMRYRPLVTASELLARLYEPSTGNLDSEMELTF